MSEFLLEVLHDREPIAKVERSVTADTTFWNPAVRESVPSCDGLHLPQKLATLHTSIIEHFCSTCNLGGMSG